MSTPDALWRAAFEQSALPLVTVDGRGLIALWNRAFEALFREIAGIEPDRFRSSLFDLIREREGMSFDYYAAELLLGGRSSATVETPIRAADGNRRILHFAMSLLEPGGDALAVPGERFILIAAEDVTDRVIREKRLLEAKEGAEKATHTKSLFLANMSHEIRTPIQTILGVVELLLETSLDGEQAEYATQVRFSAEVLLALINDILDFSKIEAGKLELEAADFDLPSCVYQAADLLVMDAHRKGLEVIVDLGDYPPTTVRGDPTRLRQIIVNLLKNAIKFTADGSIALVMRAVGDGARPRLRFEVRDTGIGIPDDLRNRLFTPFFQVENAAVRTTGGTGLGLAISRHLSEVMGGTIGVSANAPRGSVFWFEVPLSVPEYAAPHRGASLTSSGARVLVVDDSADARTITARIAAEAGYLVSEAASGDEALTALHEASDRREPFTICLIDQNMPKMDGWRLASEITGDTAINGARLILMVPEGTMGGDAKMKLLRWFNAYVSKPVRPALLLDSLRSASASDVDLATVDPRVSSIPQATLDPTFDAEILIAEDHEINRELFTLILTKLGCRVVEARDGVEASDIGGARVREGRPFDIVLTDIFMPRMNGYETSILLRERGYRGPLIAVTASALKGEREKCIEAGMDDILVKPFKKHDLALLLQTWLPVSRGGKRPDQVEPQIAVRSQEDRRDRRDRRAIESNAEAGGSSEPSEMIPLGEEAPAATPSKTAADDAAILDWAGVLDTFLGQEDTVVGLLKRFTEKARAQVTELAEALEARDYGRYREVAHSLKGASWNLAASRLGEAAKAAEQAGKEGDSEAALVALAGTKSAFEEFSRVAAGRIHKAL